VSVGLSKLGHRIEPGSVARTKLLVSSIKSSIAKLTSIAEQLGSPYFLTNHRAKPFSLVSSTLVPHGAGLSMLANQIMVFSRMASKQIAKRKLPGWIFFEPESKYFGGRCPN